MFYKRGYKNSINLRTICAIVPLMPCASSISCDNVVASDVSSNITYVTWSSTSRASGFLMCFSASYASYPTFSCTSCVSWFTCSAVKLAWWLTCFCPLLVLYPSCCCAPMSHLLQVSYFEGILIYVMHCTPVSRVLCFWCLSCVRDFPAWTKVRYYNM